MVIPVIRYIIFQRLGHVAWRRRQDEPSPNFVIDHFVSGRVTRRSVKAHLPDAAILTNPKRDGHVDVVFDAADINRGIYF